MGEQSLERSKEVQELWDDIQNREKPKHKHQFEEDSDEERQREEE